MNFIKYPVLGKILSKLSIALLCLTPWVDALANIGKI